MRHAWLAALLLLATACGGGSAHEYPDEVVDNFIHACTARGASDDECTCSLDELQQRYSAEEYSALEAKINRGDEKATKELGDVAASCTKR